MSVFYKGQSVKSIMLINSIRIDSEGKNIQKITIEYEPNEPIWFAVWQDRRIKYVYAERFIAKVDL